jgi:hypothetical protein
MDDEQRPSPQRRKAQVTRELRPEQPAAVPASPVQISDLGTEISDLGSEPDEGLMPDGPYEPL